MECPAVYYDGVVSTRREVSLYLHGETIRLFGPVTDKIYLVSQIRITSGVGAMRRAIRLPDGGLCEVGDDAFLTALERQQGQGRFSAILSRWERSLPLVLCALFLTVLVVIVFMRYGVPALARHAAYALPVSAESTLGRESLATLDRFIFKPTRLSAARQMELRSLFSRMTAPLPDGRGYRLEFRESPAIGANAMALPAGIVVMTDGLVELAKNDDELAAVLAHELGHVQGRHLLRHVLQNSVATLLMATVTGDILSVTSLSAALPTALIDAKFSRDFEREADDAAVAYLKKEGIPASRYVAILQRLQVQLDAKAKGAAKGEEPYRNYLSTHPATRERI
ncbi:MAG TPA: M48 family metallopeptidase, partial [Geobacteraceae bacterium]